jgi:putative copper export protein
VSPDLLSVVVRTLGLVGLFQAAGAAFFLVLFGEWVPNSHAAIRRLGWWAAIAGIVLLACHQGLEAARMSDAFSGLFDSRLEALAWGGSSGNAALLQILGLGVVALGFALAPLTGSQMAGVGGCIAACAAVLTGHTSVHSERPLLGLLLAVHLMLVAFWFGALLPLMFVCGRESKSAAVALLNGFSKIAGLLVPCIAVAGLTMALVLMPDRMSWISAYGWLILAKIAAFAVLLLLAAWNRWRAVPALAADSSETSGSVLRRVMGVEYLLIVAVLAMTAVLTSFYSPSS